MSRKIEFNYEASLERASRLFWKQGYANTSLRELLKKMGIGEGSFYNTLKSMKNAYMESLKHYNGTVNRKRGEAFFSAPTAALGIRALFNMVLDCLDDPHTPSPVCLMAGALTPEVLAESDLRKYVQEQMSMLAEAMIQKMASDKRAGHLPPEFQPHVVVPVVITYLQGIWRMALVSYNRSKYEKQIDAFLSGMGL